MSLVALLHAVRDHLRTPTTPKGTRSTGTSTTGLGYAVDECDIVMPGGKPPAKSGDVFLGVWPSSVTTEGTSKDAYTEYCGVTVTISMRGTHVPYDRWGSELLAKMTTGLLARAEAVRASLNMNYRVCAGSSSLTDQYLDRMFGSNAVNDFVEPLSFQTFGRATIQNGTWWWGQGEQNAGMSIDVVFAGARRTQDIASQS